MFGDIAKYPSIQKPANMRSFNPIRLPRDAGRLRALRVRFECMGLPAQPAPNPPTAAAAPQSRAPWVPVRGSN